MIYNLKKNVILTSTRAEIKEQDSRALAIILVAIPSPFVLIGCQNTEPLAWLQSDVSFPPLSLVREKKKVSWSAGARL